jgi:hypothetical protein
LIWSITSRLKSSMPVMEPMTASIGSRGRCKRAGGSTGLQWPNRNNVVGRNVYQTQRGSQARWPLRRSKYGYLHGT